MSLVCPFCNADPAPDVPVSGSYVLLGCVRCYNPLIACLEVEGHKARALPGANDVRAMAPKGSIGGTIFAELPDVLDRLPVLPAISIKVLALVDDAQSSMPGLAKLIREDSVIAAQILKIANSAFYGGLSEITELDVACARLGMRTISNAVNTVATANLFESKDPGITRLLERLRTHSIVTAFAANELANLLSEPKPESLYFAGLFHDVGKIALLDIIAKSTADTVDQLRQSPGLVHEVLHNYHQLVGLHTIGRWNLPHDFGVTTYFHNNPEAVHVDAWRRRTHIVALANVIAHVSGFGLEEESAELSLLGHPSAAFLNMTDIKLANLRVDLEEKFEQARDAFGVAVPA